MAGKVLSDLLEFDPKTGAWVALGDGAAGAGPSPRYGHGFAAAGGKLYVLGGESTTGIATLR
jgi:hypothetical protein